MYIWIYVFIYIYGSLSTRMHWQYSDWWRPILIDGRMVAWALVCIDSIQIDGGPSLLMGVVGAENGNDKRLQNAYVTRIA